MVVEVVLDSDRIAVQMEIFHQVITMERVVAPVKIREIFPMEIEIKNIEVQK